MPKKNNQQSANLAVCEVAAKLNKGLRATYRMIERQEIRAVKIGGEWMIKDKWLKEYLRERGLL